MADLAGLRIVMARSLPEPSATQRHALVLMRQHAEGQARRMRRYVEHLCSRALVLQDYDHIDRLYVRDEMWSDTGPSVASALVPGQFR